MYDPCVPEALKMFETMTSKHSRELYHSRLIWEQIFVDGVLEQIVPKLELEFKF